MENNSITLRENLISTAVKFLQNPKVIGSPLEQKRNFLTQKGLSEKEIEAALERSGTNNLPPAQTQGTHQGNGHQTITQLPPQQISGVQKAKDIASSVILMGSLTYGVYAFLRWLWPEWFGRSRQEEAQEKLQGQIAELHQSLVEALGNVRQAIQEQNEQLEQMVQQGSLTQSQYQRESYQSKDEIKSEIKSLKSILLSRDQFPLSMPASSTPSLPAWQLSQTPAPAATGASGNTSYETVNGSCSENGEIVTDESKETHEKVEGVEVLKSKADAPNSHGEQQGSVSGAQSSTVTGEQASQ